MQPVALALVITAGALGAAGAFGCRDRDEPAPTEEPSTRPATPAPKPRPAMTPSGLPRPERQVTGASPDCAPVLAGLDIAKLCGAAFPLVVQADVAGECALIGGPDAPRDQLVRIDVKRAAGRRLPLTNPAAGWSEAKGTLARARRGAYPWLIFARSRGPEAPLCDGDELAAVTARVAELLPPDPAAKEAPANAACDAIMSPADVAAACETTIGPLVVGALEDGADYFCRRYSPDRGLTLSIARPPRGDKAPVTTVDARGNVAAVGVVAGYTVELKASKRAGSGALACDKAALGKLWAAVAKRAARALPK